MNRTVDLTGKRFGLLTVVAPSRYRHRSFVVWKCHCECGAVVYKSVEQLRYSRTKHCGNKMKHGNRFSVVVEGEYLSVKGLAEKFNCTPSYIRRQLNAGTPAASIKAPAKILIEKDGEMYTVSEAAMLIGISRQQMHKRWQLFHETHPEWITLSTKELSSLRRRRKKNV